MSYNGWSNYPTWNVVLWIDNDQGSQEDIQDAANRLYRENKNSKAVIGHLADFIKEYVYEFCGDSLSGASMSVDLLGWALDQVDWREIAGHYDEPEAEVE